jgi:hypothetical protein
MMNNELDPDLRRLFAATADYPADEAFVAAVSAQTARRRPIALASLSGPALVIALAGGLGLAASQALPLIAPLFDGSPVGWIVGLALAGAGAVCFRIFGPLAGLGRL